MVTVTRQGSGGGRLDREGRGGGRQVPVSGVVVARWGRGGERLVRQGRGGGRQGPVSGVVVARWGSGGERLVSVGGTEETPDSGEGSGIKIFEGRDKSKMLTSSDSTSGSGGLSIPMANTISFIASSHLSEKRSGKNNHFINRETYLSFLPRRFLRSVTLS